MRLGIHLVRLGALADLSDRGVLPEIPEPWLGAVDLMRALEGMAPEPARDTPLGVIGLDALLVAAGSAGAGEREAVMRGLRGSLHEARGYFEWRRIPLVFIVRGALEHRSEGSLALLPSGAAGAAGEAIPLEPLFGRGMQPMSAGRDWWWAPQLG